MLHVLRVEEGEAGELVLVEVHHEELVGGREVRLLRGELPVEVGHVLPVALDAHGEMRIFLCFFFGETVRHRRYFVQTATAAVQFFPGAGKSHGMRTDAACKGAQVVPQLIRDV